MKDEKWYCEVQAPPELHEHIEQLFNAISYKIRHADGYIEGYKYGLEKSIEPNLGNNGSIYTKTGANDEDRTTDDCISRQQAIDALDKHIDTFDAIDTNYLCGLRTAMSILKEMPSAQPETHDKRTETHECDLINRQQAIDALNDEYHGMISDESMKIYQIINWISALPSAQPEHKKGKWMAISDETQTWHHCSECYWQQYDKTNFCPNCGARMED